MLTRPYCAMGWTIGKCSKGESKHVQREVWKSVAVPSMDAIAWNESEMDKQEVGQNRVARMALNAPRYTAVEALRGDMGWSAFREKLVKATLRYNIRLERMGDERKKR